MHVLILLFMAPYLAYGSEAIGLISSRSAVREYEGAIFDDYKKAIAGYYQLIEESTVNERSDLYFKLAIAYLRDQDQERAFRAFLQALDCAQSLSSPPPSRAEEKLYEDVLKIYLTHTGRAAKEGASQILHTCSVLVDTHPDYHLLRYLVALSLANREDYEPFLQLFYASYRYHPNHFLAFKTRALLHHKLMECARDPSAAETEKRHIWLFVQEALKSNPPDISLHQMNISFAPTDQKKNAVTSSLNIIIHGNMIVPRSDLLFFVKEAGSVGDWELAERFLDKARSWYPVSQVMDAAMAIVRTRDKG